MSTDTPWTKATASSSTGACVELRRHSGRPEVRDSKHPEGSVLRLSTPSAATWLRAAQAGELDHLSAGV